MSTSSKCLFALSSRICKLCHRRFLWKRTKVIRSRSNRYLINRRCVSLYFTFTFTLTFTNYKRSKMVQVRECFHRAAHQGLHDSREGLLAELSAGEAALMRDGVLLPEKQGRGGRLERNARNQSSAGQERDVGRDVLERGGCARPAALRVAGSLHCSKALMAVFVAFSVFSFPFCFDSSSSSPHRLSLSGTSDSLCPEFKLFRSSRPASVRSSSPSRSNSSSSSISKSSSSNISKSSHCFCDASLFCVCDASWRY
jgi:hypothetical protein